MKLAVAKATAQLCVILPIAWFAYCLIVDRLS